MPISVVCPSCQKTINAPDSAAGKQGKCPGCQTVISIPAVESVAELVEESASPTPIVSSGKNRRLSKPLIIAGVGCAIVMLISAGLTVFAIAWGRDAGNPLKNAKPGDWARYDMTASASGRGGSEKITILSEVLSNDGKKAKLLITTQGRMGLPPKVVDVDLSKTQEEFILSMMTGEAMQGITMDSVTIERGKKTKETVFAAGKMFDCVVTPFTSTMPGPNGSTLTATGKAWTSKSAPVDGMVKSEVNVTRATKWETGTGTFTQTLAAFGNDLPVSQKAKEILERDRTMDERGASISNLHRIGIGVALYSNNKGKYPTDLATLWDKGVGYLDDPIVFICPATEKPYQYVLGITTAAMPDTVIAYSESGGQMGNGRNVLFHGGFAKYIPAEKDFQTALLKYGAVRSESILDSLKGADKKDFEVALLTKSLEIIAKDDGGHKPVHGIVITDHVGTMKWLEENTADLGVDIVDFEFEGQTPMYWAAMLGHIETMKWLKGQGVAVNVRGRDNEDTPMHGAANGGHVDAMKWLKENGADVSAKGYMGATPMHHAVFGGNIEAMKWLKENGADVNERSDEGWTSMHGAAQLGFIDVMKWLKENGADVNAKDEEGKTPLRHADEGYFIDEQKMRHQEAVDWLKANGGR